MGSPELAVFPLQVLILNGHEVAAVYTCPDKPGRRGRDPLPTPVKQAALALDLPVIQPASLKNVMVQEELADLKPEVVIVAAYGQILPQEVLDIPPYGCINIHPSLLPKYRGAAPVQAAILSGERFAGVSVMLLDAGWDTGPVFCRAQIPVMDRDTTLSLSPRLFQAGAFMLLDVLSALPGGKRIPLPQDNEEASYFPEITREEARLDWNLSAVDIWRKVRAYQPWPEAYTLWEGKQLKIIEAIPVGGDENLEPGVVVAVPSGEKGSGIFPGVAAGRGVLKLSRVQIEGKRAVTGDEFIRGYRDFIGSMLN
ncbi:MAG: methionyl-tRNA formyltransferase [Dehalococcoidales bacterium]|nr:methionyl-tRNA formyltransferase [Dehalococcoidales bacterium]